MKVERINQTDYADIYGIYDANGKPIGTAELKIAGWEAGKIFFYPLSGKYTKKDLRKIFRADFKNIIVKGE